MSIDPDDRDRLIQRAAGTLRRGGIVVMPTETVYGVFVRADPVCAEQLKQLTNNPHPTHNHRFTLHIADPDVLVESVRQASPVTKRLVQRLIPGPARLVLHLSEAELADVCERFGVARGLVDDGSAITVRLPDHPIARSVIRSAGGATLAAALSATRWAQPGADGSLGALRAMQQSDESGDNSDDWPDEVLDDGPTLYNKGSTTIEIWSDGRFLVHPGGVMHEREVMEMLKARVLFVCTGNTCRSPMAEGIARAMVDAMAPDGITRIVSSAGVSAGEGLPAADQAIRAMQERGIDISTHRSRMLSAEMIEQADMILTMTPSHAQAVMQMAPDAVHKVFPIDPLHPVADPIGQPIEVYRQVADQIEKLVRARLQEINT